MTRTVKDAAYLLGACIGVDGNDGVTAASQGKAQKDYAMYCKTDALKGKRIGIENHISPVMKPWWLCISRQ